MVAKNNFTHYDPASLATEFPLAVFSNIPVYVISPNSIVPAKKVLLLF